MNFGQIRAIASGHLDDAGASYTTTELNNAINEGLAIFAFLTLCLERTAAFNVTTGAGTYHLLSTLADYLAPLRVTVAGAKVRPARLAELDALNQSWRAATGTAPVRYAVKGCDLLIVYPKSNATVALTFARAATLLALDTDVPEIPDLYHPALADYGTYRALAPQGGSLLARSTEYLTSYTGAVTAVAALVRTRYKALDYDSVPFELAKAAKK